MDLSCSQGYMHLSSIVGIPLGKNIGKGQHINLSITTQTHAHIQILKLVCLLYFIRTEIKDNSGGEEWKIHGRDVDGAVTLLDSIYDRQQWSFSIKKEIIWLVPHGSSPHLILWYLFSPFHRKALMMMMIMIIIVIINPRNSIPLKQRGPWWFCSKVFLLKKGKKGHWPR